MPEPTQPDAPITQMAIFHAVKTVAAIASALLLVSGIGAGAYKFASESGAKQATDTAALTLLKTKVDEHSGDLRLLRDDMDIVKLQNQRSLDDRTALHEEQRKQTDLVNRSLDRLADKVDRLLDRQTHQTTVNP